MSATGEYTDLDRHCVTAIRALSIDQPQAANSGHPGLPLGAAPAAYVVWQRYLNHDPKDPQWPDRDRFVLSGGHGSALLYSLLNLTGYDLPMRELENFRQWESKTPGHPESHLTPGVEATTGPLGQGISNAVGMAVAERWLAARYNAGGPPIVDHWTYVIASDGDIMEGVAQEASAIAGFLGLGRLIVLYDFNSVTLDGPLDQSTREDTAARYEAYGWQVLKVEDGNTDLEAIDEAVASARADVDRPSLIIVNTTIGYGSPNKAGSHEAHGSPLGEEEVERTKAALGWPHANRTFYVPAEVREHLDATDRGAELHRAWSNRFDEWASAHPELAKEWELAWANELPEGWDRDLPEWEAGEEVATRVAAGDSLRAIAAHVPWLIGGDADLATSTKNTIEGAGDFTKANREGRNFHWGVREHGMGAASNGMAYHGGVRPFAATFFVFSDYMRPSVRLSAIARLPVVYQWTHDSIGIGEDGPTHQPVEHLASFRAMPNFTLFRPADANEAAEAWRWAMTNTHGPTAIVCTRQKVPTLDRSELADPEAVRRGAYVLADAEDGEPDVIVIATGSEVWKAVEARETLAVEGIAARVVSMPSWEVFEAQDEAYRDEVLPPEVSARVSIEAAAPLGWERWIGEKGVAIGVDEFGASAPGATNMEKYGITPDAVVDAVRSLVGERAPAG
ncbi:MAG: transketolase [Gemmatimonadota bacterium]|nr:transketolase [Gemmatimonadota bacterium]